MILGSIASGARDRLLNLLGRSEFVSKAIVGLATRFADRLGADSDVIAEAGGAGRPLNRSLQIVQWSLAVEGHVPFPRHFAPGDHLVEQQARFAAVGLLRGLDDAPSDVERQLIGLDDVSGLEATLGAIESDLRTEIGAAATRPKRGDGLESDHQFAAVAAATIALAERDLQPFLMSGTLLGFIRDGRFMPHDYDVDLGLLPDADVDLATSTLERLPAFDVETVGPRIVATHESGVRVDVFPHELRDGLFWHATKIHEWWNTPFRLTPREMSSITVWIPEDPGRYLDENYGNWAVPVPFYDISFDTPNRRYRSGLDAARFLHSRCIRALRSGDRWLLESAVRELRDNYDIDLTDLLAESRLLTDTGVTEEVPPPL